MKNLVKNSLGASLLIGLFLLGCGNGQPRQQPKYAVTGSILWKGQPLPSGTIYFKNDSQSEFEAAEISNGKYSTKVPEGDRRVEIVSMKSEEKAFGEMKSVITKNELPEKYGKDSKLRGVVKPGIENVIDFELKD